MVINIYIYILITYPNISVLFADDTSSIFSNYIYVRIIKQYSI